MTIMLTNHAPGLGNFVGSTCMTLAPSAQAAVTQGSLWTVQQSTLVAQTVE